jgi:CDP-diacylglycerol--glycerol-3-phosphate 3-phosphatidyltransferase
MAISPDSGSAGSASTGPEDAPTLSRHALRPPAAGQPDGVDAPPSPEQFWNLPNTITMLRAGVVPVLLFLPLFPGERASAVFAWFYIAAAVSDLIDGWLARRGQMVTHIGKLLDPLADKLLASTALIVLLSRAGEPSGPHIPIWAAWMVVIIVGRELAVTGLRGIASAGGKVMGASGLGKIKAVAQNIAIGALLFHYETLGLDAHRVGLACLFVATALTLASGYRYFVEYFRGLSEGESGS